MGNKLFRSQEDLDNELRQTKPELLYFQCELVKGEVPKDADDMVDETLKAALLRHLRIMDEKHEPQYLLYQLSTGQQSVICFARNEEGKLVFSYRDLKLRPATKRIKMTVDAAVNEYD